MRSSILAVGFAVLFGSVASLAQRQASPTDNRLIVGVLQETGLLIPFARYDGRTWTNTWPELLDSDKPAPAVPSQIPQAWLGGALPRSWRLVLPGGSAHPIRLQGLVLDKNVCGYVWAVTTDFPKAVNTPEHSCPLRAIGIALSSERELKIPRSVMVDAPTATMEKAFVAAETAATNKFFDLTGREKFPIRLVRAFAFHTDSGETYYFLNAHRRYPGAPPDSNCARFSVFQGWIVKNPTGQERVVESQVVFTDCDHKEVTSTVPMGMLETPGGLFVIVQSHGWESESYGILKIERNRVLRLVDLLVHAL